VSPDSAKGAEPGTPVAQSFDTVLVKAFATQMFAPSKAIASGTLPTAKVPRLVPSLARSLMTLEPVEFATQRFVEGYRVGIASDCEGAEVGPNAGPQLCDGVAEVQF